MRILVVDDHATIRKLFRQLLSGIAVEFIECADGAEATEMYAVHSPDVVVMDVCMPRLDGLAATRQLRQRFRSATVVIVTDFDDEEMRRAAWECGASGVALKQDLTDLESIIVRAVANPR
jgi:DNA-binding NarL/FixJ family response regulator